MAFSNARRGDFKHDLLFKEIYICRFQISPQPATSQQTQNSSSSTTGTPSQTSVSVVEHVRRIAKPDSGKTRNHLANLRGTRRPGREHCHQVLQGAKDFRQGSAKAT